jgi:formate dehydrogenase subunit gamma
MIRHSLQVAAAGLVLAFLLAGGAQSQSATPKELNPTASSVKEQQLLEALKPGAATTVSGRGSIPDTRSRNLIQPGGLDWRTSHQSTVPFIGAVAILGMLALVTLFYLVRGKVRVQGGLSGKTMTRFGFLDRFAHWLTAVSFLALGLTGLNITFGKRIVLPLVGPETFANLSLMGKYVHNYVSFAFALGLLLMFVLWVKDNFPHPRDLLWIVKGGGLLGFHVDAARFNFGQKVIFWVVILGGGALAVTGYMMMFPFMLADIGGMQLATILHGLIGVGMLAVIIAHIYIGSIGMEGAFSAMGSGQVDVNWAKEHHSIWVDRVSKKGGAPAPAE